MDRKAKTLLAVGAFAIFMAAAGILYNKLSENYRAEPLMSTPVAEPPQETGGAVSGTSPDAAGSEEEIRLEAPDFTAVDGDGNEIRLSDFRGRPVVLNFWASWCTQCRKELPVLDKLYREYSEDELVILAVDLVDGSRETVEKGKKYAEENGFAFMVIYDTRQEAAYAYGVRFIPCTLFIDSDGYIRAGYEGVLGEEGMRIGIDIILGAK